jgi:hypothetical protein
MVLALRLDFFMKYRNDIMLAGTPNTTMRMVMTPNTFSVGGMGVGDIAVVEVVVYM